MLHTIILTLASGIIGSLIVLCLGVWETRRRDGKRFREEQMVYILIDFIDSLDLMMNDYSNYKKERRILETTNFKAMAADNCISINSECQ